VLFVGDINVDLMASGLESLPMVDREITCDSFSIGMGSSAVIAAANYRGLGGSAAVAGLRGDDDYGRFMAEQMEAHGIDISLVQTTREASTGVTINLIHKGTRTQITYAGAIAAFGDTSGIERRIREFAHVHFSGPYQQHALRPRLARLLRIVKEAGVGASLDPQWDATECWEHMDEWLRLVDYFFANRDEALSITRAHSESEAIQILRGRTSCPLVKLGDQGALVWTGDQAVRVPPIDIDLRDTTGAGDAFAAGFLYGRIELGRSLEQSARLANAVAARNCTMEGGVNACPPLVDIQRFAEEHRAQLS
jgi:sugar/nucleoside kinase (ribokinase family)